MKWFNEIVLDIHSLILALFGLLLSSLLCFFFLFLLLELSFSFGHDFFDLLLLGLHHLGSLVLAFFQVLLALVGVVLQNLLVVCIIFKL